MSGVTPKREKAARRLVLYPLAWVVVWLIGLLIGEALQVERALQPDDLDHRVWRWVIDHREGQGGTTRAFLAITSAGDGEVVVPLVVASACALTAVGWRRRGKLGRWEGLALVGFMVAAKTLSTGLKLVFDRARPMELHRLVFEDTASFPSGHALNSAAFCVAMAGLMAPALRELPRWAAVVALSALACAPVLIAASRVWLAVHFLSDVVSGLFLGALWAALAVAIHRGWVPMRRRGEGRDGSSIATEERSG